MSHVQIGYILPTCINSLHKQSFINIELCSILFDMLDFVFHYAYCILLHY